MLSTIHVRLEWRRGSACGGRNRYATQSDTRHAATKRYNRLPTRQDSSTRFSGVRGVKLPTLGGYPCVLVDTHVLVDNRMLTDLLAKHTVDNRGLADPLA